MIPHLKLVSEMPEVEPPAVVRRPFDGVLVWALFVVSGCISMVALGAVAHLGWGMVR